ncbi:MAG: DEAD/DEAH box helicase [Sulfolobales archaeon]
MLAIGRREESFRYIFGVDPNKLQELAINTMMPDRNYIVIAPTGSGKTYVGFWHAIMKGRGIYLATTTANTWEKYIWFREKIAGKVNMEPAILNKDFPGTAAKIVSSDMLFTTPFKLSQYVSYRNVVEWVRGASIIVDEIHEMPPETEFIVSWALSIGANVVGLSATVDDSDANAMARWLNAAIIKPEMERPIPIFYHEVRIEKDEDEYGDIVFIVDGLGKFSSREEAVVRYIVSLYERSREHGILFWAPTRAAVEDLASAVADNLEPPPGWDAEGDAIARKLGRGSQSDLTLRDIIRRAPVGFHHGGLSAESRRLVQELFLSRKIRILGTAYTLVEGVNLPARHLVMTTLYGHDGSLLKPSEFHQLAGRAGRPGLDEEGHVHIFIDTESEAAYLKTIMRIKAEPISSKIYDEDFMTRALLRLIAYGNRDPSSLANFVRRTFWSAIHGDAGSEAVVSMMKRIIDGLVGEGYIEIRDNRIWFPSRELYFAATVGLKMDEKRLADNAAGKDAKQLLYEIADIAVKILGGGNPSQEHMDVREIAVDFGLMSASMVGGRRGRLAQELAEKIYELAGAMALYRSRAFGWNDAARQSLSNALELLATGASDVMVSLRKSGIPLTVIKRLARNYAIALTGSSCIDEDTAEKIYEYAVADYRSQRPWFKPLREYLRSKTCKE